MARGAANARSALQIPCEPRSQATRCQLTVHRRPRFEIAERLPRRPRRHQQRVRDEHPRRSSMRAKETNRLSRLDQQRLVVLEIAKRRHNRLVRLPIPRRFARAAIDDEIIGALGDIGIEVVHQHAQRRFLRSLARQGRPRAIG